LAQHVAALNNANHLQAVKVLGPNHDCKAGLAR
jgi:hypothetical protein